MTQTDLPTSAFLKDSLKTTNNVITVIAKSTCNIQNIKMISRQSRDLIIRWSYQEQMRSVLLEM